MKGEKNRKRKTKRKTNLLSWNFRNHLLASLDVTRSRVDGTRVRFQKRKRKKMSFRLRNRICRAPRRYFSDYSASSSQGALTVATCRGNARANAPTSARVVVGTTCCIWVVVVKFSGDIAAAVAFGLVITCLLALATVQMSLSPCVQPSSHSAPATRPTSGPLVRPPLGHALWTAATRRVHGGRRRTVIK